MKSVEIEKMKEEFLNISLKDLRQKQMIKKIN